MSLGASLFTLECVRRLGKRLQQEQGSKVVLVDDKERRPRDKNNIKDIGRNAYLPFSEHEHCLPCNEGEDNFKLNVVMGATSFPGSSLYSK